MFICICNAISHRRIEAAIDAGNTTVDCIYAACGSRPQCRGCADTIQIMIDDRTGSQAGCLADDFAFATIAAVPAAAVPAK